MVNVDKSKGGGYNSGGWTRPMLKILWPTMMIQAATLYMTSRVTGKAVAASIRARASHPLPIAPALYHRW
jgi:hypothetical protein